MSDTSAPISHPREDWSEKSPSGDGLHSRLLNELGQAICAQQLANGTVLTIEEIEERYGVSRSVVRETVRVLEAMGLVLSRRRVGVSVLPPVNWNSYDPRVIRWRLGTSGRVAQLRSLTELRMAVEPEAARLAAVRAPLSDASDLMSLAGKLWAAGKAEEVDAFLSLDILFHRLVLSSSGNEMFAKLETVVSEVLTGRTAYGLMPRQPHAEALQLHVDVASAIQRSAPDEAQSAMLAIMRRTAEEMNAVWSSSESGDSTS